jgi:hypothetical protein
MGAYGGFMGVFGAICHKALNQSAYRLEGYFLKKIVYDKLEIMTSLRGRGCDAGRFPNQRGWGDRLTRFLPPGFDAPSGFQLA